jgi:hypothetical protein
MNRGVSAESPSVSRSRFTAAFRPCWKSTKVSSGQSCFRSSSRVTTWPGSLQQHREDLERLRLQAQTHPCLAQLAGAPV